MTYEHLEALPGLLAQKLITKRDHPSLSLSIYNYTAGVGALKISEWSDALKDCRGLILGPDGEVVARPFRKFWNYEQVLDQIPEGPFSVWDKLDGSLGIVCGYRGFLVVATRGSFESDQAKWAEGWLTDFMGGGFAPPEGLTYLFEIIYPENRIVVDYEGRKECQLLSVMDNAKAEEDWTAFHGCPFPKVNQHEPTPSPEQLLADPVPNAEGFVLRWSNGFRAKVKFEEYKRLHRLITQVSTRTIWELLRDGKSTEELMDRVPEDFKEWVRAQIHELNTRYDNLRVGAYLTFSQRPALDIANRFISAKDQRRVFAEWASKQFNPTLLFLIYDSQRLAGAIWKMIEPKWATPFRREVEG